MSHGDTHFVLKSGRVLLLNEPLSAEERAEMESPAGMELLERIADRMESRFKRVVKEGDPEYAELLKAHNLKP
jgi:precorrin-6B methylase 1